MTSEQASKDVHVCIIGGGFAGLRAAKHFEKVGIKYTLFEGSGRLGGRVYPFKYNDGYLQYGAEYVNGINNEIYRIAKEYDLIEGQDDDMVVGNENTITIVDGKQIDKKTLKIWKQFVDSSESIINENSTLSDRRSIEEVIDQNFVIFENSKNVSTDLNDYKKLQTLSKIYKNFFQVEWSSPIAELSMANIQKWDDGTDGTESAYLNQLGFKKILDEMKSNIKKENIRLNYKVVNINYTGEKVSVRLENGQVHDFDHVITTSSLGFLKKHNQTLFSPPLPVQKRNAIDQMGYGSNMKVFLEYEESWWPEDSEGIFVTKTCCGLKMNTYKSLTENLMVFQPSTWVDNVIVAWIAGNGPLEVSKLNDTELLDLINNYLLENLKNSLPITKAKKLYRYNWITDEFALGSYSYLTPKSIFTPGQPDVIALLGEPIKREDKPIVCFAGEHTDPKVYQTTVGAARSGLREAKRIAGYYN